MISFVFGSRTTARNRPDFSGPQMCSFPRSFCQSRLFAMHIATIRRCTSASESSLLIMRLPCGPPTTSKPIKLASPSASPMICALTRFDFAPPPGPTMAAAVPRSISPRNNQRRTGRSSGRSGSSSSLNDDVAGLLFAAVAVSPAAAGTPSITPNSSLADVGNLRWLRSRGFASCAARSHLSSAHSGLASGIIPSAVSTKRSHVRFSMSSISKPRLAAPLSSAHSLIAVTFVSWSRSPFVSRKAS